MRERLKMQKTKPGKGIQPLEFGKEYLAGRGHEKETYRTLAWSAS